MSRVRLDTRLVELGLAPSRERARALILAGQVQVGDRPAGKAGESVPADAKIALLRPDHPYVGRGGVKLAHALDVFGVSVDGRQVLDIGASTGGFTDVLLRRGAARVTALDVGRGQIDWTLRNDPRVLVLEGVNARTLTRDRIPFPADLVTIDVSFISLRHILPAVPSLLNAGATVIALVKPQFEAGRREVGKGGIVTDPAVHARVVDEVVAAASAVGLDHVASVESPITGTEGNREFFVHLRPS
jgi:23S rRNA (cytidine1920-2'-O)/16S rRNA (cytidine1409-2'-O)-methyltransferase